MEGGEAGSGGDSARKSLFFHNHTGSVVRSTYVLIPKTVREFFRCRILRPLLRLLRGGVTPRRLAWSLALGLCWDNPSVGLTTLLVIMLAWIFG